MKTETKKSNIDYLRELLTTPEQNEFLDAIQDELADNDTDKDDNVTSLESEVSELEDEVKSFEEWVNPEELHEIDCGIGKIWWKTDSMDLQIKMEDFSNTIGASYIPNSLNFV